MQSKKGVKIIKTTPVGEINILKPHFLKLLRVVKKLNSFNLCLAIKNRVLQRTLRLNLKLRRSVFAQSFT